MPKDIITKINHKKLLNYLSIAIVHAIISSSSSSLSPFGIYISKKSIVSAKCDVHINHFNIIKNTSYKIEKL